MSSAQVVMSPMPNVCERESRPSALGHFFSKFGARKNRSKSPINGAAFGKQKMAALPARGSPLVSPACDDKKPMMLDEPMVPSASFAAAVSAKPKRHSSPLSRVVHRLSMNRKFSHSTSRESSRERSRPDSHERIFSAVSSSAEETNLPAVTPRPAVSENDLRHVILRRDEEVKLESAPLITANTFHSEDNLIASTRVPSYLRISCALNGYRGSRYSSPGGASPSTTTSLATRFAHPPTSLPMGIVERRALAFNNAAVNSAAAAASASSTPQRGAVEDMGAVLNTPTPVRQLAARFDKLHISSEKAVAAVPGKENMPAGEVPDSLRNGHLNGCAVSNGGDQLIEECSALPPQPINPHSTIPVSNQVLGEALSHPVPEPVVAHAVHSGLRETIVSNSAPHQKNHSEITIDAAVMKESAIAEKVHNAVSANDGEECRSGEDFARLLDETRNSLSERSEKANATLLQEDLPEHAADVLRMAAGKSSLLLKKKLAMFGVLVAKNLKPVADDPQPASVSDLEGYWDLVKMELADINSLFAEADRMRENGWQIANTPVVPANTPTKIASVRRMVRCSSNTPVKPSPIDAEKKAALEKRRRDALEEARRRQKQRMQKESQEGTPAAVL